MKLEQALAVEHAAASGTSTVAHRASHARQADLAADLLHEVKVCATCLASVEPSRLVASVLANTSDVAVAIELQAEAIRVAADLIAEEPAYSHLACRLLSRSIDREVSGLGVQSFLGSVQMGHRLGLLDDRVLNLVTANAAALTRAIDTDRTDCLEYFGLRTLYERYLLRNGEGQPVFETPQYYWMRVAAALSRTADETLELYRLFSTLDYLPSNDTLLHAGSIQGYLASCYLLDSPGEVVASITSQRSAAERGITHAASDETSALAAPRGSTCLYVEPWHHDIETFLQLQQSSHQRDPLLQQLTLANWIPDLFMRRVEADADWSLFDPADVPQLPDLFGTDFEQSYELAEASGLARRKVRARELYAQMIHTIVDSGNGWIEFKDKSNCACNQTATRGNTVHVSNRSTELLEVTNLGETAACNLGAINLARHVTSTGFDFEKLAVTVGAAVRQLDRAIDLNSCLLPAAQASSARWRPVGLGVMGLQDVFFKLRLPFDGYEARELSTRISEAIYFHALETSLQLARIHGAHSAFDDTRGARGELQFDAWGIVPSDNFDWEGLRAQIRQYGLRNSLLVAIGPTDAIASLAGCFECIEPQTSNFFQRETREGDFLQVNPYLVDELKQLGLWTDTTRAAIRLAGGSIQGLYQLPDELRTVFRTAWELSALALIDLAAGRGAYIDQSQSLSLFMATPNVNQIARMYVYAWKCGLKTTCSLHSRWPQGTSHNLSSVTSLN